MNIFRKGLRKGIKWLANTKLITSKTTVTLLYIIETLKFPSFKNPKNLNEKIIWLAFNTDTSGWSELTDKYEVRNFIKKKGLEHILVPLLGVYEKAENIELDNFPKEFVIKATDASSQNLVVYDKNKVNLDNLKKQINKWQSHKFGYATGESHYIKIKQRIIVEKLLKGEKDSLPVDYKFLCINGMVHSCLVCSERDDKTFTCKRNLMNPYSWSELKDSINPHLRGDASKLIPPANLKEMIEIAQVLASDFPFVRVDLYEIDGKTYFGELTFTPSGFHITSISDQLLLEMGNMMKNIPF